MQFCKLELFTLFGYLTAYNRSFIFIHFFLFELSKSAGQRFWQRCFCLRIIYLLNWNKLNESSNSLYLLISFNLAYHANHPSNYHHHNHHHHHYSHPHLRYTNSGSPRSRSAFSPNLDISTAASNTNTGSLLCSINTSSGTRTPPIMSHHGATGLVCRVPTPDSGEIVTTDEGDLKTFREALALSGWLCKWLYVQLLTFIFC